MNFEKININNVRSSRKWDRRYEIEIPCRVLIKSFGVGVGWVGVYYKRSKWGSYKLCKMIN